MKQTLTILLLLLCCCTHAGMAWPLKVNSGGRYLEDQNGTPFLIHGNASWLTVVGCTTNQAVTYYDAMATAGFNAAIVMLEDGGTHVDGAPANRYSDAPFTSAGNFSTYNTNYYNIAKWQFDYAKSKGIVIFAVPLYLGKTSTEGWADLMTASSDGVCQTYGEFLGSFFSSQGNIIWTLGGDRVPDATLLSRENAIATGIRVNDSVQLMTVHGGADKSGRTNYPGKSWVQLDEWYTWDPAVASGVEAIYLTSPTLPVFFIEGRYEWESSTTLLLRTQSYHALLSGAFGQIYGNFYIWWHPESQTSHFADDGAVDQGRLKTLFDSRQWWKLVPDTSNLTLTSSKSSGANYKACGRASDGSLVMAYLPAGGATTIDMTRLAGSTVTAWWFNPRSGASNNIGDYANTGSQTFTPSDGNDWVLVLDAPLPASTTGIVNIGTLHAGAVTWK